MATLVKFELDRDMERDLAEAAGPELRAQMEVALEWIRYGLSRHLEKGWRIDGAPRQEAVTRTHLLLLQESDRIDLERARLQAVGGNDLRAVLYSLFEIGMMNLWDGGSGDDDAGERFVVDVDAARATLPSQTNVTMTHDASGVANPPALNQLDIVMLDLATKYGPRGRA